MNRRQFLASVSAAAVLPLPGFAGQTPLKLKAETVSQQILPEGEGSTAMLGFNGSMPGPEIRLKRGARASIEVENGLEEGTAVHWHGIRLENRMDGVPVLTQDLINPGDSKTYSFVPPDAGTYWYHSHYISQEQVARGLMGPLIVEDDAPLDLDHDITVILSDWIIDEDGSLVDEFTDMHSVAHAGYMGNFARGFLSRSEVQQGDRIRLRLINAATNRIFPLSISGVSGSVVALDGMALRQPRAASDLVLAPAQRADLIVEYGCRLLNHMRNTGTDTATPRLRPHDLDMPRRPFIDDFPAGYMQRMMPMLPKQGDRAPWLNTQSVSEDMKLIGKETVDDGVMVFG